MLGAPNTDLFIYAEMIENDYFLNTLHEVRTNAVREGVGLGLSQILGE